MNYTVIARRWRPKRFEDVVGQAHVVTTLKNSIRRGRIAHAYLFSGPRGVGKTSISRILAKAVNCAEGVQEEPCNVCHTCTAIDSGGFVDVIEIDAASNRGIDEIRELRETVRYLPMEARYKVYIIDEAHMLTEPAFNALLKTLEEPPGHNIFILATTESQKIPYTIMSRCQRFDFKRISEANLIGQLERICQDEQLEYDEKVLNYVVREADGSLRDAESILDQVISYSGKHVTEKDAIDVIGVVQREVAFGIVKAIVEKDPRAGLGLISDTLEQGHDAYQVYKGLVSFLRDLLMIKVWNDKPPFVFMDKDEFGRVKELLEGVERREIQDMVHHLLQAEDLVRGTFPKTSLEVLFINLYGLSQGESAGTAQPVRQAVTEQRSARTATPQRTAPTVPAAKQAAAPQRSEQTASEQRAPVPAETDAEPIRPAPTERRAPAPSVRQAPPVPDMDDIEDVDEWAPIEEIPVRKPPTPPQASAGPTRAADFAGYLKGQSTMLFGMLGAFSAQAEGDSLIITLDKQTGHIKSAQSVVTDLKKLASDFFGRDMTIRFVDDSQKKEETIDDYMKEAELLFRV
jgi:DNA polymerase III subunit gamma/tau